MNMQLLEQEHYAKSKLIEQLAVLRYARSMLLLDAEGFGVACGSIERVGQIACGKLHIGLDGYREALLNLIRESRLANHVEFERLFDLVKRARNDAVHEGVYARHMSSRLTDLIILLEDSIISKMDTTEELMVRGPVVAEPWQLVAHVRNSMLANSFSFLPYRQHNGAESEWRLISDFGVIEFLGDTKGNQRRELLSKEIKEAIDIGLLMTSPVICVKPDAPISSIRTDLKHGPVLVTKKIDAEEILLGIVTAYDLL